MNLKKCEICEEEKDLSDNYHFNKVLMCEDCAAKVASFVRGLMSEEQCADKIADFVHCVVKQKKEIKT